MAEPIEITGAQIHAALCDEIVDIVTCTAAHEDEGRTLTLEHLRDMRRRHFAPPPPPMVYGRVPHHIRLAQQSLHMNSTVTDEMLRDAGARRFGQELDRLMLQGIEHQPPDPAERENALRLLETVVGAEEMARFAKYGGLTVCGPSGAVYSLREGRMTETRRPGTPARFGLGPIPEEITLFCFELPGGGYHPLDKMIAEILMIQTDEEKYLEIANVQGLPDTHSPFCTIAERT